MVQSKSKHKKIIFKKPLLVLYFLLVVIMVAGLLEAFSVTHFLHDSHNQVVAKSTGAGTKGVANPAASEPSTTQPTQTQTPTAQTTPHPAKQPNGNTGSGTLIAPWGTFVNVYKNVGVNDNMQSTCNTSAGATCQIVFVNGSITKTLPIKTADGGGAIFWSWKPSDQNIGLTPGSWHITAEAKLGSQVKTTDNGSLELEIVQ